jgi:hypothetical protein
MPNRCRQPARPLRMMGIIVRLSAAAPRAGVALGALSHRSTPSAVLRTRLLAPRPPPECLPRDDLVRALLEGLQGRMVMVVAGAGFGKTTLLAQALGRSRYRVVWCSCDERLASSALLLLHVVAGIAEQFPGFGASLSLEVSPDEQVGALCNEIISTVSDDFVLALDDVHALPAPAAQALGLLVRDMPPLVHPVLASRGPPPFPLGRLRAGGLVEIGESHLALTEYETAALLQAAGREVDAKTVGQLDHRAGAWFGDGGASGSVSSASAGASSPATPIAPSWRRAMRSTVSAWRRIAARSEASPHPATYGTDSDDVSRPAPLSTIQAAVSTITSASARPYSS